MKMMNDGKGFKDAPHISIPNSFASAMYYCLREVLNAKVKSTCHGSLETPKMPTHSTTM